MEVRPEVMEGRVFMEGRRADKNEKIRKVGWKLWENLQEERVKIYERKEMKKS